MHKAELLGLMAKLDLHPSRSLGQNFLMDENCLTALVKAAAPVSGERVLEIGPGFGVLTERLIAAGCLVTGVELDARLCEYLREKFAQEPHFTLVAADACQVDYGALFPVGTVWRCIANLPYSCASVCLAKLAALANPPVSFHVLLQREMAERLAAPVGSKEYGVLTVRLALRYAAQILRIVPHGVFFPPPEVDSAFLALTPRKEIASPEVLERARALATAAFAQRRKQSRRLLQEAFPKTDFAAAFAGLSIPADARAEVISPAQYLALARKSLAAAD